MTKECNDEDRMLDSSLQAKKTKIKAGKKKGKKLKQEVQIILSVYKVN